VRGASSRVTADLLQVYRGIAEESIAAGRSVGANASFQQARSDFIDRTLQSIGQ
jgi:hypothetical protein